MVKRKVTVQLIDENWVIQLGRRIQRKSSMRDAISFGREWAIRFKTELHVYRADGTLRSIDTFPSGEY